MKHNSTLIGAIIGAAMLSQACAADNILQNVAPFSIGAPADVGLEFSWFKVWSGVLPDDELHEAVTAGK